MSKTTTIARMRPDGTLVEVLADGSERPFPDTPMRPMTDEEIEAAAWADPDARPFTPDERARAKRVPRTKTLRRVLGLTQEQFATRYKIPLGTLRDWEQGRSEPDAPARAYLHVIAHDPERVNKALSSPTPTDETFASSGLASMINYAQELLDAAMAVVELTNIKITENWARDPKIVGLAVLCRSISNFRAAILMVQQGHALEARVLVRLLNENLLWVGSLREGGVDFIEKMRSDEASNRRALAELTLKQTGKHGGDLAGPGAMKLREIIKELDRRFPAMKKLRPGKVAAAGVVEAAYVGYARLSLDAVHCSVTALGRHLSHEPFDKGTEVVVSVVPRTPPAEVQATVLQACRSLIGTAVGVNELLGFTTASDRLSALLEQFEAKGWATVGY